MIICSIICFTFIVCFAISAKIYYTLKINKDFRVKAKDINIIIDNFKYQYLDGYNCCDVSKLKYLGKPLDILNLIKTIEGTLRDVK